MDLGMRCPEVQGYTRSFVVAGHEEDGYAFVSDTHQGRQRLFDEGQRHSATEEEVAAVHNQVNFVLDSRQEGPFDVAEEVITATPAGDARPQGVVEAQVRICQKEYSYCSGGHTAAR
jgi:hypothetical protein